MSLAKRLKQYREEVGLSLEQLADAARTSKGYIWELENDEEAKKKPSAEMLMRIADALSITLAELLGLPTITVKKEKVSISKSLLEFKKQMELLGKPLSDEDLKGLAGMSFRGGQPRSVDEWHDLFLTLDRISKR